MRNRSSDWHLQGWRAIALLPFIIVFHLAIKLIELVAPSSHGRERTPAEVAGFLYDFIEGTGGKWDWDDFTSAPIADPQLEAIRLEAEMISLPVEPDGWIKLRELLFRAQALGEKTT